MKKYTKRLLSVAAVFALSLSLVACGDDDAASTETESAIEPVVQTEVVDATVAEPTTGATMDDVNESGQMRSYLTGLFEDKEIRNRRPVAIMTENTKDCQPQYGVSQASLIYECPAEGGIPRMMSIFEDYSGLDRIGNVRSCRPYYLFYMYEYDAIYAHAGGSPEGKMYLETGIFDDLDALVGSVGNAMYYRSNDRNAPHNLYTSAEGIDKGIALKEYRTDLRDGYNGVFNFSLDSTNTLPDGQDCEVVSLYYPHNQPHWEYNSADGLYYRYQFGTAHVDANNNEQLTATNIIVLDVDWEYYNPNEKKYLNITVTGEGAGKYITQGKVIDITWKRATEQDPTRYYDAAGNEISINPGKTWVQVCQNTESDKNAYYATKADYDAR